MEVELMTETITLLLFISQGFFFFFFGRSDEIFEKSPIKL